MLLVAVGTIHAMKIDCAASEYLESCARRMRDFPNLKADFLLAAKLLREHKTFQAAQKAVTEENVEQILANEDAHRKAIQKRRDECRERGLRKIQQLGAADRKIALGEPDQSLPLPTLEVGSEFQDRTSSKPSLASS